MWWRSLPNEALLIYLSQLCLAVVGGVSRGPLPEGTIIAVIKNIYIPPLH